MKYGVRYIILITSVLLFGAFGSPPEAEAIVPEAFEWTAILVCTGPQRQQNVGVASGTVGGGTLTLACGPAEGHLNRQTGSALNENFEVTLTVVFSAPPQEKICSFSGNGLPVHLTCRTDDHVAVELQLIRH